MEQAEALAQYRKLVTANPGERDAARKSFYDHFQIDPEGFSAPKKEQGEVSRMAEYRLKHSPTAPDGSGEEPGLVQRGLGKVVGTETAARMTGELPAAVGMLAMAAAPELAIPKAAAWGPKMLAFAKAAAGRVLSSSAAAGGTAAVLSGSAEKGASEAKTQALYGAAGEAVLGVGQAAVGAGKALAPGAMKYLRGTAGGRAATKEAVDAINEHGAKTVDKILESVGPSVPKEITGEDVGAMVRKFDRAASDSALEMFEIPKTVARGANLPKMDISPIAKDLKDIVKADEKIGGFLSPLATVDERAAAVASGSRTASRDVSQVAGSAARAAQKGTEGGADAAEQLRQEIGDILASRKASLPALMNIRGKVSQILADPASPAELKLIAKRIGTQRLDTMIEGGLNTVGAGETWRAAVKNYANTEAIKEQALYRLAKKSPERIHEFIAPNRPDTVQTLNKLASQTGMKDIVPQVQRNFLEARLGKGLENFTEEIDKFGPKTINELFTGKSAEGVSAMKDLSKVVSEKLHAVGAEAEGTRELLGSAIARATAPAAAGGYIGYKKGGYAGAAVGAAAGAAAGTLAPYQLVRFANNPGAAKRLATMISGLRPDSPPAVINAIARTIGSVVNRASGD